MKPFAFMVMPFGRKPTQAEAGKGPAEVDFDALWEKAYFPMLSALGYQPIRADQEAGSLIIQQMLERLYFSDLVLVDLTSPNGNVYYEMGVRHAACRTGCVLLAADWCRPLFDVAQLRAIRYPLPAGQLTDEAAHAVRGRVAPAIAQLRNGTSPVFEVLPGYPGKVDASRAAGVRDQVESLAAFQAELRAAHAAPRDARMVEFDRLRRRYGGDGLLPGVAVGLLRLLVATVQHKPQWQRVLDYIESLTPEIAADTYVREQQALALGKLGRRQEAIAQLLALIATDGATPEREGLIGGRYKELWRAAVEVGDAAGARSFLHQAIEHYERGMTLDLNEYYPASNLPRLYRARNGRGDEARALTALHVTRAACERALNRTSLDEWVRSTLLCVQFDLPDADKAEELAEVVEREGAAAWQLQATLGSLRESMPHVADEATRLRLRAVLERLSGLA